MNVAYLWFGRWERVISPPYSIAGNYELVGGWSLAGLQSWIGGTSFAGKHHRRGGSTIETDDD